MAKRLHLKNYTKESVLINQRTIVAIIFVAGLVSLLLARLVYLQVIQHHLYVTLATKNRLAVVSVEPKRGLIFDRNGILLAQNTPIFSLDLTAEQIPNVKETIQALRKMINLSEYDVRQFYKTLKQHRAFEPVPLKYNLTEEEIARFYVDRYRFSGVEVQARFLRHYPLAETLASVVGYVGHINEKELRKTKSNNYSASNYIGKSGIEKYYETELHGKVGSQEVEIDASGHVARVLKWTAPQSGKNIYLTIDSHLQKIAHEALGEERGAVVAIEPNTGDVLALVSHPAFDPNMFVQGISNKDYQELRNSPDKPLYNRAVQGQFPIASPIKPFFALLGLEKDLIDPKHRLYDTGTYKLATSDHVYNDWLKGGHGWVDLHTAIMVSCDPYFWDLALKLGINRMSQVLSDFGFGQLTDIDFPHEVAGVVPTPGWKQKTQNKAWYAGDTLNSGIGQGYTLATPLQIANAAATIANRGKRMKPNLLLKIHTNNKVLKPDNVTVASLNFKAEHWEKVIAAMQDVVSPQGTGHHFGRPSYSVAAKTGTAQVYRPARYRNLENSLIPKKYLSHSLFMAFAPVEKPKIALAIIIENTPGAAAIAARKIMDAYLIPRPLSKPIPSKSDSDSENEATTTRDDEEDEEDIEIKSKARHQDEETEETGDDDAEDEVT